LATGARDEWSSPRLHAGAVQNPAYRPGDMLMTGAVEAYCASLHFQTNHTEMNRRVGEGLHARFSVEAYAVTRWPRRLAAFSAAVRFSPPWRRTAVSGGSMRRGSPGATVCYKNLLSALP
jgi:hypothetical protein